MTARTADTPKLFYALALLLGFCGLPLSFSVLSCGYGVGVETVPQAGAGDLNGATLRVL